MHRSIQSSAAIILASACFGGCRSDDGSIARELADLRNDVALLKLENEELVARLNGLPDLRPQTMENLYRTSVGVVDRYGYESGGICHVAPRPDGSGSSVFVLTCLHNLSSSFEAILKADAPALSKIARDRDLHVALYSDLAEHKFPASIVSFDGQHDLLLLRADLPFVPYCPIQFFRAKPSAGSFAVKIGQPVGLMQHTTSGLTDWSVALDSSSLAGVTQAIECDQASFDVAPGDSGSFCYVWNKNRPGWEIFGIVRGTATAHVQNKVFLNGATPSLDGQASGAALQQVYLAARIIPARACLPFLLKNCPGYQDE